MVLLNESYFGDLKFKAFFSYFSFRVKMFRVTFSISIVFIIIVNISGNEDSTTIEQEWSRTPVNLKTNISCVYISTLETLSCKLKIK